ncbi:hypothetical protein RPP01_22030, partial [Enterobacter hormaechei subsp. oharae]
KIGPDPRNFNQRVSLGRNDLLIRTFLRAQHINIRKDLTHTRPASGAFFLAVCKQKTRQKRVFELFEKII